MEPHKKCQINMIAEPKAGGIVLRTPVIAEHCSKIGKKPDAIYNTFGRAKFSFIYIKYFIY
jgi:hypothetical protein